MITAASKADREQEILDQYALGQITREQAAKLLVELHMDWYHAQALVSETERSK